MRLAVLSDIRGNLRALEAVLIASVVRRLRRRGLISATRRGALASERGRRDWQIALRTVFLPRD